MMNLDEYMLATSEDMLLEMAAVEKDDSGLDFDVWLMPKLHGNHKSPRLKIKINNIYVPVLIDNNNPVILVNKSFKELGISSKQFNKLSE